MSRTYLFLPAVLLTVSGFAYAMGDVTLINLLSTDQADISVTLNDQVVGVQDRAIEGFNQYTNNPVARICNGKQCHTFEIEDAYQPCVLNGAKYDLHNIDSPDAYLMNFYVNGAQVGQLCAPISNEFVPVVHTKLYLSSTYVSNWGHTSQTFTATFTSGFYDADSAVTYTWQK